MARVADEDVLQLHLADVTFPESHPLAGQNGELMGVAVRCRRGLVLFDTGIGVGNERIERWLGVRHRSLDDELRVHGHERRDVIAIVNSHLHFDHCGNNPLFPGVPIYVQEPELAATRSPQYTVSSWVDFEGAEYRVIDGDARIAPDVTIVATPGHSVGHQSVVLETSRGIVVLAGQAIYWRRELDYILDTGELPEYDMPPDPERYRSSVDRLMALQPRRVYFSHDRDVWEPSRDQV